MANEDVVAVNLLVFLLIFLIMRSHLASISVQVVGFVAFFFLRNTPQNFSHVRHITQGEVPQWKSGLKGFSPGSQVNILGKTMWIKPC